MLIILTLSCQSAFKKFITDYDKNYTPEQLKTARTNFCTNFKFVKSNPRIAQINQFSDLTNPPIQGYIAPDLPEDTTSYTMPILVLKAEPVASYNRKSEEITRSICSTQTASSISYTDPKLADFMKNNIFSGVLPQAVDLRKDGLVMRSIDQGTCGSCWAQSTRFVMHTLFVRDLYYYKQIYVDTSISTLNNKNLVLSVQYIMNNSYGQNQFCAGGNFQYAAQDIAGFKVSSINYDVDAPYVSIFDSDAAAPVVAPSVTKQNPSDFNEVQWLNPVFWLNDGSGFVCPKSLIKIVFRSSLGDSIDQDSVNILKGFLARGIAVSGRQLVPTDSGEAVKYSQYKGGVIDEASHPCQSFSSNHQVTFVGYGTVKGVEVWVLMNSWGAQWGVSGSFYVKIGSNALCQELDAVAVMPRFSKYDSDLEPLDTPYNQTKLYNMGKNKFVFDTYPEVHWGMNGLDGVDKNGQPSFVSGEISFFVWIMAGIVGLFFIMILALIIKCLCCPPYKKLKVAHYSSVGGNVAQTINWSKGVQ